MRVFHTWSIQPYTLRKLFHTWCRPRKPPTPRVRLNCFAYSSSSIIGYRLIYLHNNINACCNPSYHYIASSNLRENVTYSQWSADIFLSVGKLFEFGTVSLCSQTQRYVNNVCLFAITDVLLDTRLHFGDAKFQSKHKWQCAGVLVYFIHQSCEKKNGGGGIYSAVGNHKQVRFFQFDGQPMISSVLLQQCDKQAIRDLQPGRTGRSRAVDATEGPIWMCQLRACRHHHCAPGRPAVWVIFWKCSFPIKISPSEYLL